MGRAESQRPEGPVILLGPVGGVYIHFARDVRSGVLHSAAKSSMLLLTKAKGSRRVQGLGLRV